MKKLYQVNIVKETQIVVYCEEDEVYQTVNYLINDGQIEDEFYETEVEWHKNDIINSQQDLPSMWDDSCLPYTNANNKEELTIKEILTNQNSTRNPNNLEFNFSFKG